MPVPFNPNLAPVFAALQAKKSDVEKAIPSITGGLPDTTKTTAFKVKQVVLPIITALCATLQLTVGTPLRGIAVIFHLKDPESLGEFFQPTIDAFIAIGEQVADPKISRCWYALTAGIKKEVEYSKETKSLQQKHTVSGVEITESARIIEEERAGCNYTREMFQNACNDSKDKLDAAFKSYEKTLQSRLPNVIEHGIEGKGVSAKVMRCGGITDARYGWFSQKELRECAKDPEKLDALRTRLQGILGENENLSKADKKLAKKVASNPQAQAYLRGSLNLLGQEDLGKAVENRKQWLAQQYAKLLVEQLKSHKVSKDGSFTICQLSLLHDKPKVEKQGIMHDERVISEDMAYIFREFNGKEVKIQAGKQNSVVFEQDGTITIYVPNWSETSKITLTSVLLQVSIQGNNENTQVKKNEDSEYFLDNLVLHTDREIKKANNELEEIGKERLCGFSYQKDVEGLKKEIERMRPTTTHPQFKLTRERLDALSERLDRLEKVNAVVIELRAILSKNTALGVEEAVQTLECLEGLGALGVNCYSAKDRTGTVVARYMKKKAEKIEGQAKEWWLRVFSPLAYTMGTIDSNSLAVYIADISTKNEVKGGSDPKQRGLKLWGCLSLLERIESIGRSAVWRPFTGKVKQQD